MPDTHGCCEAKLDARLTDGCIEGWCEAHRRLGQGSPSRSIAGPHLSTSGRAARLDEPQMVMRLLPVSTRASCSPFGAHCRCACSSIFVGSVFWRVVLRVVRIVPVAVSKRLTRTVEWCCGKSSEGRMAASTLPSWGPGT